jgi:hypothetical protein
MRRSAFLGGVAALLGSLAMAGCGSSKQASATASPPRTTPAVKASERREARARTESRAAADADSDFEKFEAADKARSGEKSR